MRFFCVSIRSTGSSGRPSASTWTSKSRRDHRKSWAMTQPGDQAEHTLKRALERKQIPYRIDAGGGAFYGPKIDVKFRDAIGRLWQGPTIFALDFQLPERFELEYTGADKPHRPVMIHRAIYGTLERSIGALRPISRRRVPHLVGAGAGSRHLHHRCSARPRPTRRGA